MSYQEENGTVVLRMSKEVDYEGQVFGDWYSGAVLSLDGAYRYSLWRRWEHGMGFILWIMLNPSTANHQLDDATIRRCIGFSRQWGYGGMEVVNLFALRTTYPSVLLTARDPVGPKNARWIERALGDATMTCAAWGAHGNFLGRSIEMRGDLSHHHVLCLGKCANGEPKHPVRLPYAAKLEPFIGKSECLKALNARLNQGNPNYTPYQVKP